MKKESGPWSGISAVSSPRAGRCDWSASFVSPQRFLFCLSIVNVMFLDLQLKINSLKTNNRYQLVKTLLYWEISLSERCLIIKSASFCLFTSQTQLSESQHRFGHLHCYNVAVSDIEVCVCAGYLRQRFWFCVTSKRADIHIWSSCVPAVYQRCSIRINWNVWFKTELFTIQNFFILYSVHLSRTKCKTPI